METATAICRNCRAPFPYEPILCLGRDLAASLHRDCPRCEAAAEEEAAREAKSAEQARKLALRNAILPPDLLATTTHHPDFNTSLWRACRQWSPGEEHRNLGIIGPAGRCKTRVLALLASQIIMRGSRVVWTSAVRLHTAAEDRRSRIQNVSIIAREHLQECLSTPWLFLDDLGKNEWSPAFESQLFQILDHRLNHRLPIAWTSNAHPEEFHSVLTRLNASPIIGRLLDRCLILDLRDDP